MLTTITGIVTNGVVVPTSPLPEGTQVEILLKAVRPEISPEMQEEFDGWERAGARTIEMVEHSVTRWGTSKKKVSGGKTLEVRRRSLRGIIQRLACYMATNDDFNDDVAITPFDPAAGIRFKCGRVFTDRERQLAAFQQATGFKLPADFVEMIGENCEGTFGGYYRVYLRASTEIWWTHLLLMKVADEHDTLFHGAIALLRALPDWFNDARGLSFFPFGEACAVNGPKKISSGYLGFDLRRGNSVSYVSGASAKRIHVAKTFRDMMLGSYFVCHG